MNQNHLQYKELREMAAASPVPTVPSADPTEGRKLIRWAFFSLLAAVIPMAIAGEVGSGYLWALAAGCSVVAFYAVHTISPELARERYHPPSPGLDGATLRWVRLIIFATVVFALLDSGRWHVSAPMPAGWRIAGLVAFFTGVAMFVYAMSVNRFFSSVVRIQDDRGHHVIDRGPYARVRHPGYVGMLLFGAAMPLALGSWWAFLPGSVTVGFGLRRVWIEDRFLAAHLPGYREYAARVRYRLLPGIW
jgi:protein-S-isoprenylcysteine O-methyltransferase Ste14